MDGDVIEVVVAPITAPPPDASLTTLYDILGASTGDAMPMLTVLKRLTDLARSDNGVNGAIVESIKHCKTAMVASAFAAPEASGSPQQVMASVILLRLTLENLGSLLQRTRGDVCFHELGSDAIDGVEEMYSSVAACLEMVALQDVQDATVAGLVQSLHRTITADHASDSVARAASLLQQAGRLGKSTSLAAAAFSPQLGSALHRAAHTGMCRDLANPLTFRRAIENVSAMLGVRRAVQGALGSESAPDVANDGCVHVVCSLVEDGMLQAMVMCSDVDVLLMSGLNDRIPAAGTCGRCVLMDVLAFIFYAAARPGSPMRVALQSQRSNWRTSARHAIEAVTRRCILQRGGPESRTSKRLLRIASKVIDVMCAAAPDSKAARCCRICGATSGRADASRSTARLQMCSRCRSVRYCSRDCQREHWSFAHKCMCTSLTLAHEMAVSMRDA